MTTQRDHEPRPDEFRLFECVYTTSIHDERAPVNGYITNRLHPHYGMSREEIAKERQFVRVAVGIIIAALVSVAAIAIATMAN